MKPIETRYAGHRFRSRLEARYAVMLDHLGVRWEYEPQGYDLPSGPYLPDFWLPEVRGGMWLEVKPADAPSDPRHEELADSSGHDVAVTNGMPRDGEPTWMDIYFGGFTDFPGYMEEGFSFQVCPDHGQVVFEYGGYVGRGCSRCADENEQSKSHPRVMAAYDAARMARFEHGESGAPA